MDDSKELLQKAGKTYSRIGFSSFSYYALSLLIELLAVYCTECWFPDFTFEGIWLYVLSMAPMYLVALPLAMTLLRKTEVHPLEKEKFGFKKILLCIPVIVFFAYAGSILGNILSMLCSGLAGIEYVNPVLSALESQNFWTQLVFVVLLGPFLEEFFFRKVLIDRLNVYGEKLAVFVSAMIFGLFHGNFSQIPYAFLIGLLFSYIYLRSGQLKYSFVLHAMVNLFNGVLPVYLLSWSNTEQLLSAQTVEDILDCGINPAAIVLLAVYYLVLINLAVGGLIIFCLRVKKLKFEHREKELPEGKRIRTAVLNPGMLAFLLLMIAVIADGYFSFLPW